MLLIGYKFHYVYSLNRALLHLNSSGSEELSSGSEEYVCDSVLSCSVVSVPSVVVQLYSEPSESCQSESADEYEAIPQSGVLEIENVTYNSTA